MLFFKLFSQSLNILFYIHPEFIFFLSVVHLLSHYIASHPPSNLYPFSLISQLCEEIPFLCSLTAHSALLFPFHCPQPFLFCHHLTPESEVAAGAGTLAPRGSQSGKGRRHCFGKTSHFVPYVYIRVIIRCIYESVCKYFFF